jgi:hypothetical protein
VAIEQALANHNNHRQRQHKRHNGLSRGLAKYNTCLPPRCDVPMDEGCTQPLSSDPMINLNTIVFFLIVVFPFARNLHKLEPLALTRLISWKARSRLGRATHTRIKSTPQTHTQVRRWAHKTHAGSIQLEKCSNLKNDERLRESED